MNQPIAAADYTAALLPWADALPAMIRPVAGRPDLAYYGTGESAHWPVQSNCNIAAALAVLAADPDLPEARRATCRVGALSLLRYAMATHLTGDTPATDGKQWGHAWISVLGLERMAHGINALRDHLTNEDRAALRRMTLSEADWLLEHYEVVAGMDGFSGKNKPESNIWNGGYLWRAALDYPDAPNAARYREKAASFILNGISHPLDAACETKFYGKTVREWHLGFNFTPTYSLDHHAYCNVGYMVICLSNLAMLHFNFKERGQPAPAELYWHAADLWALVKQLTFPDGRLMRVGGDTRARYTYCQTFAIPAWLFAADYLGDADAAAFERGWLDVVRAEADHNGDGSFYGKRLANIRDTNYFYYARLESDAPLCLSYGAYWRRLFKLPERPAPAAPASAAAKDFAWGDDFHGASARRDGGVARSWVWRAGQGATALCVPLDRSDMAEWQRNMLGVLITPENQYPQNAGHERTDFPGGFLTRGANRWTNWATLGEGEGEYHYATQRAVACALPDGKTMLVLDYAVIEKEVTLTRIQGLNLLIPNDIFNGSARRYRGEGFDAALAARPPHDDTQATGSDWLTVDGRIGVRLLYGADGLTIRRPAEPVVILHKPYRPWMHSLYADAICSTLEEKTQRLRPGTVALDSGAAVTVDAAPGAGRVLVAEGLRRGVAYTAADGVTYALFADFSDDPALLPPAAGTLLAELPGAALYALAPA